MINSPPRSSDSASSAQSPVPFAPIDGRVHGTSDDAMSFDRRSLESSSLAMADDARPAGAEQLAWFALLTRSRHERRVHEQLVSKGVESFLPSVSRWSRWRDRRKLIDWPLFPGYCFARCASRDIRPVLTCKGVVHLVSFAAKPAPVPDYEIDGIRLLLASTLPHDPCPFIDIGTMVKVVYGPLRGARGRLIHKDRNTTLVLGIEMLGRALSVQVDAADVVSLGTES
jgi:transcription antitermination factor NusG